MSNCSRCNIYFNTFYGLHQHKVKSTRHFLCQYGCNVDFTKVEDLLNHLCHLHESTFCVQCGLVFDTELDRKMHFRTSDQHQYCTPCDRHFISKSNLRQHLNSSAHRTKDVGCPFRCGAKFISRSALILHLEIGRCASGANHNTVNRFVRQFDTIHLITDPSRLITKGESSLNKNIRWIATNETWNGRAYECYLCHSQHRTLNALQRHFDSPTHQDQIYICPESRCGDRFKAFSALMQHIESEKCGVSRFRSVQNAMDSIFGHMRRLTLA
ncbi:hypothetical protein BDN70DRAFT_887708 [Pholiota conissans]|uniref:C2H2-type domain-containing protein n=1 Tax=Pholiota conissans TaxID=109636 RepID=A0A9P5YL44_9AGAR|nr:hypothetical protein BDN70DRAFT_887708 [Pholiota conissans]